MLDDANIAEVLNGVSRRIVKEKGPVVMDTIGFTEKGIKRKAAVQALFSKLLYLSEVQQFTQFYFLAGIIRSVTIYNILDQLHPHLYISRLPFIHSFKYPS